MPRIVQEGGRDRPCPLATVSDHLGDDLGKAASDLARGLLRPDAAVSPRGAVLRGDALERFERARDRHGEIELLLEEPPRPLSQPPPQRLVLDQASERGLERHLVLDWDEEAAPLGLDDLDEAAHAGGDDGEPERHRLDHDEAERLVARRETEDVGVRVRLHQRLVGQPSSEGHARHDLGIAGELAPEDGSIGFSQLRVLGVLAR